MTDGELTEHRTAGPAGVAKLNAYEPNDTSAKPKDDNAAATAAAAVATATSVSNDMQRVSELLSAGEWTQCIRLIERVFLLILPTSAQVLEANAREPAIVPLAVGGDDGGTSGWAAASAEAEAAADACRVAVLGGPSQFLGRARLPPPPPLPLHPAHNKVWLRIRR